MSKDRDSINNLRVASPCTVGWERMSGDERVRFCDECSLHVYNISEMTGAEVRALVAGTEGRICGRLYRRADGTVLTKDCPVGLRAVRRRIARAAGVVFAATLGLFSVAFGQSSSRKDKSCEHVAQFQVKRTAAEGKQNAFGGAVTDELGAVIFGAKVTLTNEKTKKILTADTNDVGAFDFSSVPEGRYSLEIKLQGFDTFKLKHLEIKQNETARADVILKVSDTTVTVGLVVDSPDYESSNGTTVIRGDMLRRMPLP
jgi:carboxypeptidase family protein